MPRQRQRLSRDEVVQMMIDAGVVDLEYRSMVLGSLNEVLWGENGIDADKNGFFKRSDVCRLIGYAQMAKRG
jgi:hypothetical protein